MSQPSVASPPEAGVVASRPTAFTAERDGSGVLVLTLDVPDARVNVLGRGVFLEFEQWLQEIENDASVRAVVLRSGKPDSFVAGADIKDFVRVASAEEGAALSRKAHAILAGVERARIPIVIAIHGACLGGGTELALACRYRVASSDPRTAIGLPEVMLGLLPGAGGSQRLPRLVGLATSLDMILTGRPLKAPRALKAGLVDEVCPAPILLDVAKRAALDLAEGHLRPRRPGILLRERLLRPLIFAKARSSVLKKTGGHYPAPLEAIEVVRRGTATTLDEGLRLEAEAFGRLIVSDASRALVTVFFATQEIKKDAGYPEGTPVREVTKLGVLGAGLMGAGIAGAAAEASLPVRMKDASNEALGRGLKHVRDTYEERRRRRSLTRLEVGQRLDRISTTLDYTGFGRADLVIEAVFEDLELKRQVLAETEAAVGERCVFASNTSSIPIGEIAQGCRRPRQVLGMHFFSPVHRMPLLEVVVTPQTAPETTALAVGFGRRIGKHVIVVRDGPGFYTSRTLAPYMNEAAWLLEEGAAVEDIDGAMTAFGFPVGPVTLLDEVGIDVGAKVAKVMHDHLGERMAPPASMAKVLAAGRRGRKSRKGFYTYDGRKKRVDETVYRVFSAGGPRRPFPRTEVEERLLFAFLNESVRCLEEGVLRSARDGDVGAIFGLGFPPFLGGPFRHLDRIGAPAALATLERLRERHGIRFEPAALLRDRARSGGRFHATGV
jgi:3-hydroxyacyl-CoA dehydrogenase/enoyl-CoA hydratase/3-hydroxybutyryl-CoA epimerase